MEEAIKDQNEKIRTFTPLTPIIGVGNSSKSNFLNRLNSLNPNNPRNYRLRAFEVSGSDSDRSIEYHDDSSDTDVAGEKV